MLVWRMRFYREAILAWIADRLPKRLVYQAGIRLWAHGTTSRWSAQEVSELTLATALERWKEK